MNTAGLPKLAKPVVAAAAASGATVLAVSIGMASAAGGSGTYDGASVNLPGGPLKVEVNMFNGSITTATTVNETWNNPTSVAINEVALPKLNAQAVATDGKKIDTIAGATATCMGYKASLQSAMDLAKLG